MNHLSGFGVKAVWVRVLGVDYVAGPAGQAARRPSLQRRAMAGDQPLDGLPVPLAGSFQQRKRGFWLEILAHPEAWRMVTRADRDVTR